MPGSSPRVRGAATCMLPLTSPSRIIPARAGSSAFSAELAVESEDHPRACGEQVPRPSPAARRRGSSPRVRGAASAEAPDGGCLGSSPRVRGAVDGLAVTGGSSRIIPARAGSSRSVVHLLVDAPDHPRACGEQEASINTAVTGIGSSPRVRGAVLSGKSVTMTVRIIPARAGSSVVSWRVRISVRDHPRACGEQSASTTVGYSP